MSILSYTQTYNIISMFSQSNSKYVIEKITINNPHLVSEAIRVLNYYKKFMNTKHFPSIGGGGFVDVKACNRAYDAYVAATQVKVSGKSVTPCQ
jgi:hypothetical protein